MLVLSRQRNQAIMIGDEVEITVVDVRGEKVRLGINAPRSVSVHRKEIYEAIRDENRAAAEMRPEHLTDAPKVPPPPTALPPQMRLAPPDRLFAPRVSLITLGVQNLQRSIEFYRDRLGWTLSKASSGDIAFIQAGGLGIALYPREELAKDAQVPDSAPAFSGITLAQNVPSKDQVDATLKEAAEAGAKILKPAIDTTWGGRSGYFADPDGHIWEIAWNPHFPLAEDGSLVLP